jgi:hypothetical protein
MQFCTKIKKTDFGPVHKKKWTGWTDCQPYKLYRIRLNAYALNLYIYIYLTIFIEF